MIWEPFVLALFLGLIVSAGLYFAYLWPSVEPSEAEPATVASDSPAEDDAPKTTPATSDDETPGDDQAGAEQADEASSTQ